MTAEIILADLGITFLRVLGWTSLSWLSGLALSFVCYRSKPLERILLPVVNFIRHISPFCWLPLIILIAGLGELSVGLTLSIALIFHCVIIGLELLRSLPKGILEQAKLDGENSWQLFWHIELPLSLSGFVDIYRVLWGVGWSTVIAAEMLGVSSGLGFRLLDFRYLLMYREMLVYIAIIGCIGIGTDYLLRALKSYIVKRIEL